MKFDKKIFIYYLLLIHQSKMSRIEKHISSTGIPVPLYGKFQIYPIEQVKYLKENKKHYSICTIKFEIGKKLEEETPQKSAEENTKSNSQINSKKILKIENNFKDPENDIKIDSSEKSNQKLEIDKKKSTEKIFHKKTKKIDIGKDIPIYSAILQCGDKIEIFHCEKNCNFEIKEKYYFFFYHTFDFDVKEMLLENRTDFLLVNLENIGVNFFKENCTVYISAVEILKIVSVLFFVIFG